MVTEKEWADFGRKIYDRAMNAFKDKPVVKCVIPFLEIPSMRGENFTLSVTFDRPPAIVKSTMDGNLNTKLVVGYLMSSGEIEWQE